MKPLLALRCAFVLNSVTARADLPKPDPDDGSITVHSGFRALVVADNLVDGRMIDSFREGCPRGSRWELTAFGATPGSHGAPGEPRF
jgi:hypothetical protein